MEISNPEKMFPRAYSSIEIFLCALYYFCFIPCRPLRKGDSLTLKTHQFQKILCGIVHFSALWNQVTSTILDKLHADILASPINLIPLILSLLEMLYLSSWMNSFWLNRDTLRNVVSKLTSQENNRSSSELPSQKSSLKTWIRNIKNGSFTILLFILYFWTLCIRGSFMPTPQKRQSIFQAFFKNSTNSSEFRVDSANIVPILEYTAGQIKIFLFHSVEMLALILIREGYMTASWFKTQVVNVQLSEKLSPDKVELLFASYVKLAKELEAYFVTINKFGSPFFLSWYCMVLPWMSYSFLETFSNERFPWTFVYNWGYLIILTIMLVFCAETRRQVDNFQSIIKKCVFHHDPQLTVGKAVLKQVKYCLVSTGIHVGPFAVFSYGFFGSTIGLVIAYTFLILQLHISAYGVSTPAT